MHKLFSVVCSFLFVLTFIQSCQLRALKKEVKSFQKIQASFPVKEGTNISTRTFYLLHTTNGE